MRHILFAVIALLQMHAVLSQYRFKPNPAFQKVAAVLKQTVMEQATWALQQKPETVTATFSARSAGGRHDFYSEGDYWWPNLLSADSPYVQRDGMTNPDNFVAHRQAMIRFSRIIGALASAYLLTHDEKYANHAMLHCRAWLVDSATMMNPHLLFAQAIKGRVTGRGIGIIDTIHLIEVAQGLRVFSSFSSNHGQDIESMKKWFEQYLTWLTTHPYGKDEMNALNNHGTCWVMQVAAFARLTGNEEIIRFCEARYKSVLLPGQMANDGSFPLELRRTKPYGYSIFNLDAMTMICQVLSDNDVQKADHHENAADRDLKREPANMKRGNTAGNELWYFSAAGGQSIKKGIDWLYPFLNDKTKWPYGKDVMYWDEWPVAQPGLLFGALRFDNNEWFRTWSKLDHSPRNEEVIRNLPIRNPLIWLCN